MVSIGVYVRHRVMSASVSLGADPIIVVAHHEQHGTQVPVDLDTRFMRLGSCMLCRAVVSRPSAAVSLVPF